MAAAPYIRYSYCLRFSIALFFHQITCLLPFSIISRVKYETFYFRSFGTFCFALERRVLNSFFNQHNENCRMTRMIKEKHPGRNIKDNLKHVVLLDIGSQRTFRPSCVLVGSTFLYSGCLAIKPLHPSPAFLFHNFLNTGLYLFQKWQATFQIK